MKMSKTIIIIVCLALIPSTIAFMFYQKSTLSENDFPLHVDLSKTVFNVGDTISFSAIIINNAGKDVNMSSNGEMPCVFFHNLNNTLTHAESTVRVDQIFKANEKIIRVFEYQANEAGTYVLEAHYRIVVDNVEIQNRFDEIIVEVR